MRFDTLDPRPTDQACKHNQRIFTTAYQVYGVEVTREDLAARCEVNSDPQHSGKNAGLAAIEVAMTSGYPMFKDDTVVTVREDGDSVGSMAIYALRSEMAEAGAILAYFPEIQERARQIAAADKEADEPWPGPRPAATVADLVTPLSPVMSIAADHGIPLGERVELVAYWLQTGELPGEADIRRRLEEEARDALADLNIRVRGQVAVVVGSHRLAFSIGYRYAPVVVAANPRFSWQGGPEHLKYTIGRWNTSTLPRMDWQGMQDQLNAEDPAVTARARWGGSSSIIGSPQGVSSGLPLERVVEIVEGAR